MGGGERDQRRSARFASAGAPQAAETVGDVFKPPPSVELRRKPFCRNRPAAGLAWLPRLFGRFVFIRSVVQQAILFLVAGVVVVRRIFVFAWGIRIC